VLTVDRLSSRYGRIQALREVSLEVRQDEIVALVGGNSAGKTTC
jgi:branched-chain amino acid transport system ATP-binding protein